MNPPALSGVVLFPQWLTAIWNSRAKSGGDRALTMVTIRFAVPALRSAWRLSRSSIDHFIHKFVIEIFLNGSQTAGATGIRLT